jgi:catechol 2,3-dioxygenase-like lactoylglutathione lyase family enzyme
VRGQGCCCQNRRVLTIGLIALGVGDVRRAAEFWCEALGYELREDGFGGWATVLVPPGGAGTKIALQHSQTSPQEHPRLDLDLHVADATELLQGFTRAAERPVPLGFWEQDLAVMKTVEELARALHRALVLIAP